MMERHLYRLQDGDKQQVYIFNVERTATSVTLKSIWLIVIHNGYETKIILNIPGLMEKIAVDDTDKTTPTMDITLNEMFSDMVLAQDEVDDLVVTEIEHNTTQELLDAAFKAEIIHNETFDDIVARLNDKT
jgi:hypothetical protein